MNDRDFDELAGRVEAVCRLSLELAVNMEARGIVNGPHLSTVLRHSVQPKPESSAILLAAQKTLGELADALDASRKSRQLSVDPQ